MRPDVLLEFKGAIPRFSLFTGWDVQPLEKHCEMLASPTYNTRTTVLVSSPSDLLPSTSLENFKSVEAVVTKKTATIKVKSAHPAILRFSQRYRPGWQVFVDGEKAKLLKVDYLCMGVNVPPGEHVVEFKCASGHANLAVILSIVFVSVGLGTILIVRK